MAEMKGIKLCGECANYDWKKHKCKMGCNDDSNAQASFYGDCPLPDVAPKSEVDKWYHEYHVIKDELKQEKMYHRETEKLADKYCAELQTAKTELARKIFAEIDSLFERFYNDPSYSSGELGYDVAELKKKYTEENK